MRSDPSWKFWPLALLALAAMQAATAADADVDALALESAVPPKTPTAQQTKILFEAAAGVAQRRDGSGWREISRLSLDGRHGGTLSASTRYSLSARVDATAPRDVRVDNPTFSLREAFVSWQGGDAANLIDLGRINLRSGPAYGYNPTDYFRDNALRTITTADPVLLRENRLGVAMIRGQHLWADGSLSLVIAPKLASQVSGEGLSFDWGATNRVQRVLASINNRWSGAFSSQLLMYKERGSSMRWGASATALLSDSVTAHGEWARSRETDLLAGALALPSAAAARNRAALGLTYTTSTKLSLTTEYQYNGFALARDAVRSLPTLGPKALGAYFATALARQDNAARRAVLLYLTQRDLVVKNLELTTLAKVNLSDGSHLIWADLRYRQSRVEWALQLQRGHGSNSTEFGVIPFRESIGVLVTVYF